MAFGRKGSRGGAPGTPGRRANARHGADASAREGRRLARPGLLECRLTSNPCVLAIAYGIENTSACCPAVWITASWASARPPVRHGRSEKGRGAMALSLDAAAEVFREAMRDTVKRYALWYLIQGVLLIAAGVLAIIYPIISSAAVIVLLGWLLIISGIVQGLSLIGARHVPHFWLQLVILPVLIGCPFLRDPAQGLMTIALLPIVFFMMEGI